MNDVTYERQRRYARNQSAAVADIGDIPAVENPDRRASCEFDLKLFLQVYFPQSTGLSPFSVDHERAIERIQRCAIEGGLFVQVFPRGYAKSTISENSVIWAVLYGHRRFVPIFGAGAKEAEANIDSIKLELSENDLLYADFPEVCHAIRALEGKPQRCGSQTHDGSQTHIEWRADTIVLPTIEGSAASGAIIAAHGIMAANRGMKHKSPSGTQQRPDFIVIDDPQTDDSAATALQVNKRLSVIRKSILKLGGHSRKLAVVMNATVIRPNDLVEQVLNPRKFPAWQGERIKMVTAWAGAKPDETNLFLGAKVGGDAHEKLWMGDYARLRNTYDRDHLGDQQRAHREATEFYRLNQVRMDEGCCVAWASCYDQATEKSAIQHAYNLLIDDGDEVFASECQNQPLVEEVDDDGLKLKPDEIAEKLNGLDRGVLPLEASRVVAFIDPKKDLLYWTVCAFADGFGGAGVDYGTFPDQRQAYFSSRKVRRPLGKETKADSWEAALYAGLNATVNDLMGRQWKRSDGTVLKVERCLIDHGWGEAKETIDLFCRQSPHAVALTASKGVFVGASSMRSFGDYKPQPGERVGPGWRMSIRNGMRSVVFDANQMKSFVMSRWRTPMGGKGCLTLWGHKPDAHRLFADHQVSEDPVVVEARGRRVVEFKQNPQQDNDYFDCVVGCHVAASMQGVSLHEKKQVARKRVSVAELQKNAKHWDATQRRWVSRN